MFCDICKGVNERPFLLFLFSLLLLYMVAYGERKRNSFAYFTAVSVSTTLLLNIYLLNLPKFNLFQVFNSIKFRSDALLASFEVSDV